MLRACTVCGAITDQARCPTHRRPTNAHWSKDRNRANQAKFSRAVMKRAGNRCEFVDNGVRCLYQAEQAHHTEPGNNDPATGVALCRTHHRLVDKHAR